MRLSGKLQSVLPPQELQERYRQKIAPLSRKQKEELLASLMKAESQNQTIEFPGQGIPVAKKYQKNPVKFVEEILGVRPRSYQRDALNSLVKQKRVCIRGPHGIGKSALAAWIVLWALAVFPEVKVPTTATAWRQLTEFLWPEIRKWAEKANWSSIGMTVRDKEHVTAQRLTLSSNRFAFALSSNEPARIEGAHAERIVYVFDEAREIDPAIWDAAEGAFVGGEGFAFAISTPGAPAGRFYEIQSRKPGFEDWFTIHVTYDDAVREVPGFDKWAIQREKQWGRESSVFKRRVLGDFAEDEEGALIPLDLVERSNERWIEKSKTPNDARILIRVGMDVGGAGASQTVLARLYDDNYISILEKHSSLDTDQNVGWLKSALNESSAHGIMAASACVDAIGIGVGVTDVAQNLGLPVAAINISRPAKNKKDKTGAFTFRNVRAYLAWKLRERLDPALTQEKDLLALPPDDELTGDLVSMRYKNTSSGIQVESKELIKKRLGRSPDSGDAVTLLMAEPRIPARLKEDGVNPFFQ